MPNDGSSQSTDPPSAEVPQSAAPPTTTVKSERSTSRTAMRDLERTQFDALEAAQLRDLDR